MTKYEVVGKAVVLSASIVAADQDEYHPSNDQKRLEVGDVYDESEIPDDALESFSDRFEEVTVVEDDDDESELPDPADYTVDEFEELLADGEHDDVLDELEAAEESGDNRDGVAKVIDERR